MYETEHGIFEVAPTDKKYIKAFNKYGGHQKSDVNLLLNEIDSDSVVISVGAHVGTFDIPFAKKAAHVHSFEPTDENYEYLLRNIKLNNIENITTYPFALSDTEETFTYDYKGGGTRLASSPSGSAESRTLDSFNLSPTLINLDCEGMELQVLKGSVQTLKKHRPTLFIEVHMKTISDIIQAIKLEFFLRKHNYSFYINASGSNAETYRKKKIFTLLQGGRFFNALAITKR